MTSKVQHLADMDVISGNFGCRGEALSSIADVSVLDVLTKARGRPNGYRKVMKVGIVHDFSISAGLFCQFEFTFLLLYM